MNTVNMRGLKTVFSGSSMCDSTMQCDMAGMADKSSVLSSEKQRPTLSRLKTRLTDRWLAAKQKKKYFKKFKKKDHQEAEQSPSWECT